MSDDELDDLSEIDPDGVPDTTTILLNDFKDTGNKVFGVLLVRLLAAQGRALDKPALLALVEEMADFWLEGHAQERRMAYTERRNHEALFLMADLRGLYRISVNDAADEVAKLVGPKPDTLNYYWDHWANKDEWACEFKAFLERIEDARPAWKGISEGIEEQLRQDVKPVWKDLAEETREQWRQDARQCLERFKE